MIDTSRLDEVAQAIAQTHSQQRVKKLLVYACHGSWQSDPLRLNQYDWVTLLQTLQQITPTFDRLQAYLATTIKTLNKPAEYRLVANVIANCCRPLYAAPSAAHEQQRYDAIAAQLSTAPEALRIKKLLVCACHNVWENDSIRLDRISFNELVQELHSVATDLQQLQAVLESIVKTLNRQERYRRVAQTIVQMFVPLYQQEPEIPLDTTDVLPKLLAADVEGLPQPDRVPAGVSPLSDIPLSARIDALMFDVRLEIFNYANPLRAKLLLFSALHEPIDLQQINLLKTDDLDCLLRSIIRLHPTPAAVELHLDEIAQQLSPSSEYRQMAQTIARSLQRLYQHSDMPSYLRSPDEFNHELSGSKGVTNGKTEQIASANSLRQLLT